MNYLDGAIFHRMHRLHVHRCQRRTDPQLRCSLCDSSFTVVISWKSKWASPERHPTQYVVNKNSFKSNSTVQFIALTHFLNRLLERWIVLSRAQSHLQWLYFQTGTITLLLAPLLSRSSLRIFLMPRCFCIRTINCPYLYRSIGYHTSC